MTDTAALIGYGTTFSIGAGTTAAVPGSLAAVAEVTSINGIELTKGLVEATHLTSANRYKEFIDGLKDTSQLTGVFNWVPAGPAETALLAAFNSGTRKPYRITFPNGATWTFIGVMTKFAPGNITAEGKLEGTFMIKPSGDPLIDDGA